MQLWKRLEQSSTQAKTLRNRDSSGVVSPHSFGILSIGMRHLPAIALLTLGILLAGPPQDAAIEKQLEAAIHREMVDGDLKDAIAQYQAILAQPAKSRPAAAQSLFRMAQCLEKLGQRKEAHANYTRVAGEFADQPAIAAQARAKLAGWTDALPGPRNLRFEQGEPGEVPPGWFVPSVAPNGARLAELRRKGCRNPGSCVVVSSPANAPKAVGDLMQSFSAAAFRGKTVRLRAWLRLEAADPQDRAQMWLRVVRKNGQSGFFDDMNDRPVRSPYWTKREISSQIDTDAQFLDFGVSSIGKGHVWADDVSFEIVPQAEIDSARDAVQNLYARSDAAYRQGVADDPALVDVSYRRYSAQEPLLDVLGRASRLQMTPSTFQTAIVSFQFAGPGAIATVRSEFTRPSTDGRLAGVRTFRDTWALAAESWTLKQRIYLTGRFTLPPTDAQTTRLVAADLKQLAAPLATAEAGHTFYDLTPFGNAIGDARVVALGGATEGTREFLQMKHRLFEYLVKEKGFTVLAVPGKPAESQAIDRYIKTGVGDPGAALAALHSPEWDTQEALDVVEWMRTFNQALIPHPTLSFVGLESPEDRPGERIVLWANNQQVRQSGNQTYAVGFAFRRGELRAAGFRNGNPTGLADYAVPALPEGAGDPVLSAAGMPLFFLDIRAVEPMTTLGRWLAEPHLFLSVGASWNQDGPENHLRPSVLSKTWNGLIFVEEGHAAKPMEAPHASR